ncbi:hypothetical protein COTS27_01410 [Spirochaetota bacterium]|nr:hypothetical protein COTS27_01410 [Spirochaetota bacterium]
MIVYDKNPYDEDSDRHVLWELLVRDWIEAMLAEDFSKIEQHFVKENFWTLDAAGNMHLDSWRINYTDFLTYKKNWTTNIQGFIAMIDSAKARLSLYKASMLRDIEIKGDLATVHMKFNGNIPTKNGPPMHIEWRTLYWLRKLHNEWKIASFVENLPFIERGRNLNVRMPFQKTLPADNTSPKAVGPYSPVLIVRGEEWVVISGQVPVDSTGKPVGTTIEDQTRQTLANAKKNLLRAGIGFENVFKVNVYLTDLANWPKFNEIYREIMPAPLPARTAVASGLLPGFLVEVDMWAAK